MRCFFSFAPLALALSLFATPSTQAQATGDAPIAKRARVIIDNDFGGDPDGLFQLAHHLLSPSIEVLGIIGSHHHAGGFYGYPGTADHAVEMADQLLAAMNLTGKVPVFKGANESLADANTPVPNDAVKFIVQEALREDTKEPLYLVCGAGLTDTASAWLTEPKIATKLRLIWIGGPEYPGTPPPPGASRVEYNLSIDRIAAQVVFNQSDLPLWQIPRNTYRQALVSHAELKHRMQPENAPLPRFLLERLEDLMKRAKGSLGEAYVLGDSPLVLLTALQSSWEIDPSSSKFIEGPAPRIDDKGQYADRSDGRNIRVYTNIDTRLMFEDFYAKVTSSQETQDITKPAESTSNIHLYLDGQWGVDSDIYIYPDGTYSYETYTDKDHKAVRKLQGKIEGLFPEVIRLVDENNAWSITPESLKEDFEKAKKESAMTMEIADGDHQYLTIKTEQKELKADFYEPDTFSEAYPTAKELGIFSSLTRLIIAKTDEPEKAEPSDGNEPTK
ncbi:nucleoside hydrolase [Luteolibacter soli]|uniref:Nucleoside hydrolase n=1 Tax=Luteolibacter soli TaxID=3135280 RepID=A0ABU9ASJ7_9BACT